MSVENSNGTRGRLPPALELEAMKVLWTSQKELSVAEVQEAMRSSRSLAYTTVLTLLERLYRRGQVTRRKRGRGYAYQPLLERDAAVALALDRLVHDFFDDSPQSLLAHLQKNAGAVEADDSATDDIDSVLL